MPESTPETIDEAIEQVAKGMLRSESEEGKSMETLSIDEMIKAKRHLSGTTAATKSHFGMRMVKCIPPGGG